jgi:hypothetical protein
MSKNDTLGSKWYRHKCRNKLSQQLFPSKSPTFSPKIGDSRRFLKEGLA